MQGFIEQESDSAATSEDATAPSKKSWQHLLLSLLALSQIAVVLYIVDAMDEATPQPVSEQSSLAPQIAALEEKISLIEAEQNSLDKAIIGIEKSLSKLENQDNSDSLKEQMQRLKKDVTDVQEILSEKQIAALMNARRDIAAMQKDMDDKAQQQWHIIKLITLSDTLEQLVTHGQPYEDTLRALALIDHDAVQVKKWIRTLEPYAENGAPTLDNLSTLMRGAIESHYRTSPEEGDTLLNQLKGNLASLMTIRKVGSDHEGDEDDDKIARAEADLSSEDVESVLREISRLSDEARPTFDDLIDACNAYLDIQETLREIDQTASLPLDRQEQDQEPH